MKRLTAEGQARARAFVRVHAQPLDRALLDGEREAVLAALAERQTADGGFCGMEADFDDGGASSIVNTLRALETLAALRVPASHPLAAGAIASLKAAYAPDWRSWPLIPRHDNGRPHAPWWRWSDDFAESWGFFADNPRPAVAAVLHAYADAVDRAILAEVTDAVVRRAAEVDPAAVGKDAVECYARFACAPAVPAEAREAVFARVVGMAEATLATDPAHWDGYVLQPLDVVDAPDSPLHPPFREHVERHLDHLIETQGADGAWSPHWSWMGAFPEAWERARVAWQGRLTVARLRQLSAFGRIP